MSSVSETIVREYFELHEFFVRQQRKHTTPGKREDDDIDFFVLNPHPRKSSTPLPFVLSSEDLAQVEQAIVVVKGWHTETFTPAVLLNAPEIFRFAEPAIFKQASGAFDGEIRPLKILVVPALPLPADAQDQSIALLRAKGIDAVIAFRTMLVELIEKTQTNRNYQKSDLLQVVRILKNYEFFKEQQLELFKSSKSKAAKSRKTD